MALGKILSSFRASVNLREKATSDPLAPPIASIQIFKSPIIVETTPVSQPKRSFRWVKSLSNLKTRPRPVIPNFTLLDTQTKPKVGLNIIKLFQEVDNRFSSYFDLADFEPADKEMREKRSLNTLRRTYEWQCPGSTDPPYPPCMSSIPRDEQTGLLQIFNAERLIDTAVALLPSELQPKALSLYLYGQLIGKAMAGIEARMTTLLRANKNIASEASIGNRDDWYTDVVFAQQSFTGPNPTTIELASTDWIQRFKFVANIQGRVDMATLLVSAKPESYSSKTAVTFEKPATLYLMQP